MKQLIFLWSERRSMSCSPFQATIELNKEKRLTIINIIILNNYFEIRKINIEILKNMFISLNT